MQLKKLLLLLSIICIFGIFTESKAQMCTADAGEPVADPAALCPGINSVAGSFGLATGGFTDAGGMVDPQTTNYIAFDAAGNLIDITDADGNIDLSDLAIGDMACVYQVAYSQETLNDATLFLDNQLCVVLCDAVTGVCAGDAFPGFCPGISPTDLAALFNLLDMAFGFNEAQACNLIDNSILTLPIGPLGADLEINLETAGFPICADKSEDPYCAALVACAEPVVCDLMAGEPVPTTSTICAAGTATMGEQEQDMVVDVTPFFGPPVSGVSSNTVVQDYVVVDLATSAIISVESDAMLDLSAAALGESVCVYSFAYYLELVELLAAGINDQICNVLCLPDPGDPLNQQCVADLIPGYTCGQTPADIAGLLDLLNMINQAQGLTDVTFADVQMLCATQMLTIDVGAILGVPGTPPVSIDLTLIPGLMGDGFCCDFSNDPHCVMVVDCGIDPPMCSITNITATSTCMAGDANYTVTITVTGADASVMIDGGAGPVPASTTTFTYPAGTMYTVTVTDADNVCAFGPFTGQEDCIVDPEPPTTDIPTLSQWGLLTLAMLLMIVGAIKLGAPTLFFEPSKLK